MKVKKVKLNDTLLMHLLEGKSQNHYKNACLLKFLSKKKVEENGI